MEFEDIIESISKFNNDKNHKNTVLNNNLPEISKDIKGNQYDLEQHNWKIQYYKYKKSQRDAKKGIIEKNNTELSCIDTVQDTLQQNEFKKDWNKMNIPCKKIKITEYLNNFLENNNLKKDIYDDIKRYLFIKVCNKQIKGKDVFYDKENQKLIRIFELENKYNLHSS